MSDSFTLSKAVIVWRKFVEWSWNDEVARIPERLRLVAEGRADINTATLGHNLDAFAIVQPAETAKQFGVLAPTVDVAVASRKTEVGGDKQVGIYEIGLASVGNTFECLGFAIADTTWTTMRAWIPRFEVSRNDKRVYHFWDAGLIAIALGDRASARRIAGHRGDGPIPFEAGATFQMNMRGFVHHLAGAVEAGAAADDVVPAFHELLDNYRRYQSGDAADEATLLWAARIVHHQLGGHPLGTTAQFLHDTIWKLAGEPA